MKIQTLDVELKGLSDIMFDKFVDHSKEVRPPEQKFYLAEGNAVVMPSENVFSFLTNEKPGGCAKRFEKRGFKDYVSTVNAYVNISPAFIPFLKDDKPVIYKDFSNGALYIHTASPVTKASGGAIIKQPPIHRPTLRIPWSLAFQITLIENPLITENKLHNWFEQGGIMIALGAYRNRFGRFTVEKWEIA